MYRDRTDSVGMGREGARIENLENVSQVLLLNVSGTSIDYFNECVPLVRPRKNDKCIEGKEE